MIAGHRDAHSQLEQSVYFHFPKRVRKAYWKVFTTSQINLLLRMIKAYTLINVYKDDLLIRDFHFLQFPHQ